jgi:DHA1 family bicyclomycin/chloramphenicol resistance-like MFS transporter
MKTKPIGLVLLILAPSILLRALAMDISLPCVPAIAQYYQADFSTSQWVLSLFFVGAGVGQLIIGPLADEYGRRPVLLISTILLAITSVLCAMAPSLNILILLRLIQGISAGGTTDVTMAIIRDLYDNKHMPKVYSYLNSIVGLAPLLAPLIGGLLLTYGNSWQLGFYFVAGFSLIAFIINYVLAHETNPRLSATKNFVAIDIIRGYKQILLDKQFLIYTFCAIAAFSCLFMFFSNSAILMIEILGVSPTIFGYYFALNSVSYIIGNLFSPMLQSRVGGNGTILYGSLIIVIGAACMFGIDFLHGLTIFGIVLPNLISTFGIGLIFGPCMAGVMQHYKHIAGMASAAYGALLYGSSSLLVAAIMQYEVIDTKLMAMTMIVMGLASIIAIRRLAQPHRSL